MRLVGFYCHYRHYQRLEFKTNEERRRTYRNEESLFLKFLKSNKKSEKDKPVLCMNTGYIFAFRIHYL